MKKLFTSYATVWATLLVLFNVIAFVSVGWANQEKYTASFWVGYVFITLAFIGQFICTTVAFKAKNLQKMFYNISLISLSWTGLITSFVVGGLCMLISPLPYWVGIILCAIILALNVVAVAKATAAVDIVSGIDGKVKESTLFIKSLTVDAESLLAKAESDDIKSECKKVYEAIRYSDPVSCDTLSGIESQITIKFSELANAVNLNDAEMAKTFAKEVIILVDERNKKCKLLK